jgi:hypothetical protein
MTAPAAPASLAEVLAFRHPGVIRRYCKDHGASAAEAEEVFREMLKWLYLGSRCPADGEATAGCVMTPDIVKLDWMWHAFLLFTADYAAFCDRYFGSFLHHVPEDEADEPASPEGVREQLGRQYLRVYDVLGEQTLLAWYDECRYAATA